MECTKVQFSKNQANRVIKGRKLSHITKKKSRMYLCPFCFFYHLTTTHRDQDLSNGNN